jgi:hypothetical protein
VQASLVVANLSNSLKRNEELEAEKIRLEKELRKKRKSQEFDVNILMYAVVYLKVLLSADYLTDSAQKELVNMENERLKKEVEKLKRENETLKKEGVKLKDVDIKVRIFVGVRSYINS